MAAESSDHGPLAFGDFIDYLRAQRFSVGVGDYLRLQQLLNGVDEHVAPTDLKTLLCPIFATSKSQQKQFHDAFDAYFQIFQPPLVAAAEDEIGAPRPAIQSKKPLRSNRALVAVVSALIVLGFGTALWILLHNRPTQPNPTVGPDPVIPEEFPPVPIVEPTPPPETIAQHNPTLWERYGTLIRYGAIGIPLFFFLVHEIYRFNRRRLILQKQRGKRPPYSWPLKVELKGAQVYESERFHNAARLMRRRQIDEFNRLDVERTIAATIAERGYATFRYQPYSKAPEYLVLIDRASFRDHQAQLFDHLIGSLKKEGIFLTRYFYDGDPGICSGDAGTERALLTELQSKYAGHRLLIFGDGEKLLDPVSGEIEPWVTVFSSWHDRAILTPEPPGKWGLREIALAGQFTVVPATLEGLLSLIDNFDSAVTPDLRRWRRGGTATERRLENLNETDALKAYLGEETFQLLCACAVYPELQWDLTLHLGLLPCMERGLIREQNLTRLIRLPWFRKGSMPDEMRWTLIGHLQPNREKAIRSSLVRLLEENPPPQTMSNTFATDAYQLTLFVQQWLYLRTRKSFRNALKLMKTLSTGELYRDKTVIRYLESGRNSPLSLLLPHRLRKLFYRDGVPAFGMKTSARLVITAALVVLAFAGIRPPASGVDSMKVQPLTAVAMCRPLLFLSGKADLTLSQTDCLDQIAAELKDNPSDTLVVDGHSSSPDLFNLSLTRANRVSDYLQRQGIEGRRITVRDFGNSCPDPSGDERYFQRVEVWRIPEGADENSIYELKGCEEPAIELVEIIGNLDFQQQPLNQPSATKSIRLVNKSSAPLTIKSVTTSGALAKDFFVSRQACFGAAIPPRSGCEITVFFDPTDTGPRTASLDIDVGYKVLNGV